MHKGKDESIFHQIQSCVGKGGDDRKMYRKKREREVLQFPVKQKVRLLPGWRCLQKVYI